jgi:hypothetical protein
MLFMKYELTTCRRGSRSTFENTKKVCASPSGNLLLLNNQVIEEVTHRRTPPLRIVAAFKVSMFVPCS